jgi:hypothetical protein
VLFLIFILVNPVFVYFFSFLFEKDGTASIITRLFYILTGAILPLAVSILAVIPATVDVAKVVKWIFYIIPIYSLNMGIIDIGNRKVESAINHREIYQPLDITVAGASILFLFFSVFFYWGIIYLFEVRAFMHCKKKLCGRR